MEKSSMFIDPEFTRLTDAFKAKQLELKKDGRGNKSNATSPLLDEEIDIPFAKKSLGKKFSTVATQHSLAE